MTAGAKRGKAAGAVTRAPGADEKPRHNRSNKSWLHAHLNDHYVQRAQADGFRSRAAYKLIELDDKHKLLRPGMVVVDLGSAPGSWSQVVSRRVIAQGGRAFALDLLPMDPIHGVEFIQGDFREDAVLAELQGRLGNRPVDLVLSDLAPNLSGIAVTDQARAMLLTELTLDFCQHHLKPGGDMLTKVFQGSGFDELRKAAAAAFETVAIKKPAASRDRSTETYLLCRGRRG